MKRLMILFFLMSGLMFVAPVCGQTATVTLAWDANDPSEQVTKYSVYQATVANGPWAKVAEVSETTATVAGLTPGVYYFHVTATNIWQESGPSNIVNTPALVSKPKNVITVNVTVNVTVN